MRTPCLPKKTITLNLKTSRQKFIQKKKSFLVIIFHICHIKIRIYSICKFSSIILYYFKSNSSKEKKRKNNFDGDFQEIVNGLFDLLSEMNRCKKNYFYSTIDSQFLDSKNKARKSKRSNRNNKFDFLNESVEKISKKQKIAKESKFN